MIKRGCGIVNLKWNDIQYKMHHENAYYSILYMIHDVRI